MYTHIMRTLLAFLVFCLPVSAAETYIGFVTGLTDGDTITLRTDDETFEVRLLGIDAPERGQPFGTKARQALSGVVFNNTRVTLLSEGKDRYGRTLGTIILNGADVNEYMVRRGWAWWYEYFAKDNTRLRDAQAEAQQAKRGLWADPNPIPPWEWRKGKR